MELASAKPLKGSHVIPRINLPMLDPEEVVRHLGAPHHYVDGRSAKLIATTWFSANGLPTMVRHTLATEERFSSAELIDGFLERSIDLGDGRRPSQADVLAIIGVGPNIGVMTVEGKVNESFGPYVAEWIKDRTLGKMRRLNKICATLGLNPDGAESLRYQLLHRTASAIYEAHRYRSRIAVMMVHSFDPEDAGLADYITFATAIGLPGARPTRLVGPVICEGVELYLGWTADRHSSEGFTIVDGRKMDNSFHGDI